MKKQTLTQYEVVFVVQGYLKAEDGDIGELTCNGLIDGRENCQIRQLQTCTRNQKSRPRSALRLRRRLSALAGLVRASVARGIIETDGVFYLKDGRWYYTAAAESPQEAYDQAVLDFEAACVGEVKIMDWFLEHVSDEADNYWYREDLDIR